MTLGNCPTQNTLPSRSKPRLPSLWPGTRPWEEEPDGKTSRTPPTGRKDAPTLAQPRPPQRSLAGGPHPLQPHPPSPRLRGARQRFALREQRRRGWGVPGGARYHLLSSARHPLCKPRASKSTLQSVDLEEAENGARQGQSFKRRGAGRGDVDVS